MPHKSPADPRRAPALPGAQERARSLAQRLAGTRARVEVLKERTDRLRSRDRIECRSLLQSLEMRHAQLAQQLERLVSDVITPEKKWARLEASYNEVAEHLGFLSQIICARTHEPPRRVRT